MNIISTPERKHRTFLDCDFSSPLNLLFYVVNSLSRRLSPQLATLPCDFLILPGSFLKVTIVVQKHINFQAD